MCENNTKFNEFSEELLQKNTWQKRKINDVKSSLDQNVVNKFSKILKQYFGKYVF